MHQSGYLDGIDFLNFKYTLLKTNMILKTMVWKRRLLSNMASFGIHVKFRGGTYTIVYLLDNPIISNVFGLVSFPSSEPCFIGAYGNLALFWCIRNSTKPCCSWFRMLILVWLKPLHHQTVTFFGGTHLLKFIQSLQCFGPACSCCEKMIESH